MRRLAKQSREDTYKSNRDYQTIQEKVTKRISVAGAGPHEIIFANAVVTIPERLQAWGGYMASTAPVAISVRVSDGGQAQDVRIFELDENWRRIGGLLKDVSGSALDLAIEWSGEVSLDVWGITSGAPQLALSGSKRLDLATIDTSHLIPETFYLAHDCALDLDPEVDFSTRFAIEEEGRTICLKKCSYCGRQLPLDPNRLGALAFHKHNDKKANHQNECRACKKWRINDTFNPRRTPDQLHESSVITRERKIFLREPERLQEIKDRTGAGLRSQVWERFSRKCFRCDVPVDLDGFQLDHTRPLAYLWPIDEFATCLCATCNNEKKEKFPAEFYTPKQIRRLSVITGLPVSDLTKKDVKGVELDRILADLSRFARDWEPRTFFATARKVAELRPSVDLMALLQDLDPVLSAKLRQDYLARPAAADEE